MSPPPRAMVMGGTLVYDLDVTYDPVDVSGTITGDGEWLPASIHFATC